MGECEDGKKMEVMGKIIFPICWNSMCLKGKIGDDLRNETARGEGGGGGGFYVFHCVYKVFPRKGCITFPKELK